MKALAPHYRRLAALAILLLALILPLSGVLALFDVYRSNQAQIANERAAIARLEAIAAYAPEIDETRVEAPDSAYAGWFLSAKDPAIAAADLQAKLKNVAQTHGLDVAQARDLKPRLIAGATYVGVAIDMSGRAEAMEALLRAVSSHVPFLIVDVAHLRAETSGMDPRYDPIVLSLALEVWAALGAGPAPAAAPAERRT